MKGEKFGWPLPPDYALVNITDAEGENMGNLPGEYEKTVVNE